jgi:hypothetical protein
VCSKRAASARTHESAIDELLGKPVEEARPSATRRSLLQVSEQRFGAPIGRRSSSAPTVLSRDRSCVPHHSIRYTAVSQA